MRSVDNSVTKDEEQQEGNLAEWKKEKKQSVIFHMLNVTYAKVGK